MEDQQTDDISPRDRRRLLRLVDLAYSGNTQARHNVGLWRRFWPEDVEAISDYYRLAPVLRQLDIEQGVAHGG